MLFRKVKQSRHFSNSKPGVKTMCSGNPVFCKCCSSFLGAAFFPAVQPARQIPQLINPEGGSNGGAGKGPAHSASVPCVSAISGQHAQGHDDCKFGAERGKPSE